MGFRSNVHNYSAIQYLWFSVFLLIQLSVPRLEKVWSLRSFKLLWHFSKINSFKPLENVEHKSFGHFSSWKWKVQEPKAAFWCLTFYPSLLSGNTFQGQQTISVTIVTGKPLIVVALVFVRQRLVLIISHLPDCAVAFFQVEIRCFGQSVVPTLHLNNLVDLWLQSASTSERVPASIGSSAKDFVMVLAYARKVIPS